MNRLLTILLALSLDLLFGDPPNRFHPVVLMGNWLSYGRRLAPDRRRFRFGAIWTVLGTAVFSLPWLLVHRILKKTTLQHLSRKKTIVSSLQSPITNLQSPITILALNAVFAYRNLRRSVIEVGRALAADDLPEARRLTGWHLVSRETDQLSAEEVAGAAIESLAENLTDSVAAPLMAYAVGGLPAAWGYRFINTADAMWGYRNAEFEALGKFPARLDDVLNWLPARITGWALVGAAWVGGLDGRRAVRVMIAQHNRPASPNAGWTMSAMAGALNITLTKHGVYRLEGGAGKIDVGAIQRAVRLADGCVALIAGSIGLGLVVGRFVKRPYDGTLISQ